MSLKQKLIDFINRRFNFKASDADYEYSAALYHIRFDKVPEDEKELEEYNKRIAEYNKFATEYEQQHPVDAIDRREEIDKLAAKKHITCFDELKFVKPNRHVGEDICSHPFTGSYEHKDENGNWVEGPALGHGYEGGYDYSFNADEFFGNLAKKIKAKFST